MRSPPSSLGQAMTGSRVPSAAAACDEVSSLEVRWIFPGELEPAVAGWFGRFPAVTESREDTYQMNPQLRGLSVKIRGNWALEVKSYCGSQGILEVPGRARGHIQAWHKWSFPVSHLSPGPRYPRWLEAGTQDAAPEPVRAGTRRDGGT